MRISGRSENRVRAQGRRPCEGVAASTEAAAGVAGGGRWGRRNDGHWPGWTAWTPVPAYALGLRASRYRPPGGAGGGGAGGVHGVDGGEGVPETQQSRRSSSARASASASALGAWPRAQASSARASSARSACSDRVGVPCARSSTTPRVVVPCSAAGCASRSRAAVLALMLVSYAAAAQIPGSHCPWAQHHLAAQPRSPLMQAHERSRSVRQPCARVWESRRSSRAAHEPPASVSRLPVTRVAACLSLVSTGTTSACVTPGRSPSCSVT